MITSKKKRVWPDKTETLTTMVLFLVPRIRTADGISDLSDTAITPLPEWYLICTIFVIIYNRTVFLGVSVGCNYWKTNQEDPFSGR